ncbi:uncharacterized protein [Haliotis asinina]|uniref:uncharacterized protein n=1 Tax=Haliotis asinina TaxID=109174 RepID=UPI0035322909
MGFGVFFIFLFIAVGYCLECPKCHFASNTNECVRHNETCSNFEDECIGIVNEWKITMGCGTQKRCAYEALQANVDCRGTRPFGAKDKCVVCCTGDTCNQRLDHVQKGLDLVPEVLHCPVCSDETDPQKCLDNIQPCHSSSLTCEIIKLKGKYTSSCAINSTCMHDHKLHPGVPDCLHDPRPCSVCCNDFSCIDYVLGVPPTAPYITPGIVPGGDNSSTISTTTTAAAVSNNPLTAPPMTTCRDDTLFPCHKAVGAACTDPDISIRFCPLSCGVCQVSATPAAMTAVTTTTQGSTSVTKTATTLSQPRHLQCPSCDDVSNIHDCLTSTETCHHSNEVCQVSVSKWHIKAGCKAQLECTADGSRSTINCTGGGAFGPSDKCSVCCTGDDCRTSLMQVQKGFDAIPHVLHCPTCQQEADPQTCMATFGPCDSHHGTCKLVLEHGLLSAKCEQSDHCLHHDDRKPDVVDCDNKMEKCITCCQDYACINRTLSFDTSSLPQAPATTVVTPLPPSTLTVATTPTPVESCKDKDLFPCHISATVTACNDAQFASEFCPLTCGVCKGATTTATTTRVPKVKCKDSSLYPCLLNVASTCPDPDLALLFCPLTCGLCEAGTDMTPSVTLPMATESTVVPSGQPGVMCPVCKDAANAKECLGVTHVCKSFNDVCKVTMTDWKVTAGCSHTRYCRFQRDHQSTINCTGGEAFGPHDSCSVCCTGDECLNDLNIIQKNLESIPNVLHCPACTDVADPQQCLLNAVPCSASAVNCLIRKTHGLYSAECNADQNKCSAGNPVTDCPDNSTQPCQSCCLTGDCVIQSLSKPSTTDPPITVGIDCNDDPTFPCAQTAGSVCSDPDFSVQTCPRTCGHCGGYTMSFTTDVTNPDYSTIPPLTIKVDCHDDPTFPCSTPHICDDVDFATQTCPKTCGHC